MTAHPFQQFHGNSIIVIIFLLLIFGSYGDEYEKLYKDCSSSFSCGNYTDLSYPFWKDQSSQPCGHPDFKLKCEAHHFPIMTIDDEDFRVVSINQRGKVMTIARMDFWDEVCPQQSIGNTTLNYDLFNFSTGLENVSLYYDCDSTISSIVNETYRLPCAPNDQQDISFYAPALLLREWSLVRPPCRLRVDVPVQLEAVGELLTYGFKALVGVLKQGFNVSYYYWYGDHCLICTESGGRCGTNLTTTLFTCLCPDQPQPFKCSESDQQVAGNKRNIKAKVGIGIGASFGSIILMLIGFFIYLRRKKRGSYAPSSYVSKSISSGFSSKSDIEKGGSHFGVHLFTYEELEHATNNFDSTKELGEGGFGTVYYGKLRDGRIVAVKRLYENNYKRVEQFMNEVYILTRLRHQNLVSLYGCTSRHCRELLLVYEYISNGTVADHLHGEKAKPGELPWSIRMKIAVETASALTYLHASDIIHRDVKTNNILLDNNFCVKVADFGLSRLFPTHVTHISTAPQGTPGYVDPEYHECYQLTTKSDVYSLGVVLIELISSMPAVDITRHRHEINLSNLAINKIQSDALHELVDRNLGYESDYAIRKMINAVAELAFQCLQSDKDLRPSMEEVLQTLVDIQSADYNLEREEKDIRSDNVGLLKGGPLPPSPDTVMFQWTSNSTTPNTSG